ncbi:unnamed protein product [Vitrella brassicaformis CCMP3155]|uniref:Uncharacterized protein n=4 Tax=Vitrella brassicaformis TaxID=1169539 RepID=A0A0G4ESD8_VITBC|nr:unnamed protein product [Vitrella brassicaformis CCMP3155]|eukprot:CEM00832.1 unnamed protein product [Vitrella brassicaformis CCMP3155]
MRCPSLRSSLLQEPRKRISLAALVLPQQQLCSQRDTEQPVKKGLWDMTSEKPRGEATGASQPTQGASQPSAGSVASRLHAEEVLSGQNERRAGIYALMAIAVYIYQRVNKNHRGFEVLKDPAYWWAPYILRCAPTLLLCVMAVLVFNSQRRQWLLHQAAGQRGILVNLPIVFTTSLIVGLLLATGASCAMERSGEKHTSKHDSVKFWLVIASVLHSLSVAPVAYAFWADRKRGASLVQYLCGFLLPLVPCCLLAYQVLEARRTNMAWGMAVQLLTHELATMAAIMRLGSLNSSLSSQLTGLGGVLLLTAATIVQTLQFQLKQRLFGQSEQAKTVVVALVLFGWFVMSHCLSCVPPLAIKPEGDKEGAASPPRAERRTKPKKA